MKPPVFGQLNETKHVHPWFKRELLKRYPDAYIYKPPAGAYGKKGAHDFMFCIYGLFFTVEAKVPGNTMTPKQVETQCDVYKAGGFSEGLTGKDEEIFEKIKNHIDHES
jgi:hypothetical protein